MPLPHPSRRTGRRLLATGALAAVAVLGTPAIASAEGLPGVGDIPVIGNLVPAGTGAGASTGSGTGTGTGTGDPTESIEAGAACFEGLASGIQVSVEGIVAGLGAALAGLSGQSPATMSSTSATSATGFIPLTPAQLQAFLTPEQLATLLAGGQGSLTVPVAVIVNGVTRLVDVVMDFASCLAALVPAVAPASPTPVVPAVPAAPEPVAPVAVATTAAPVAAAPVAYPGYAPTGGAPTEDSGAPLALAGLAALSATAGGGALWLRGRRGVTG